MSLLEMASWNDVRDDVAKVEVELELWGKPSGWMYLQGLWSGPRHDGFYFRVWGRLGTLPYYMENVWCRSSDLVEE